MAELKSRTISIVDENEYTRRVEVQKLLHNQQYDTLYIMYTEVIDGVKVRKVLPIIEDHGLYFINTRYNTKMLNSLLSEANKTNSSLDLKKLPAKLEPYANDEEKNYETIIYVDNEENYYYDILGTKPISKNEMEEMESDEDLDIIKRHVILGFLKRKKKKVIYQDEEENFYKDKNCKKPLEKKDVKRMKKDLLVDIEIVPVKIKKKKNKPNIVEIKGKSNPKKEEVKEDIIVYIAKDGKKYREGDLTKALSIVKLEELNSKYNVIELPLEKKETEEIEKELKVIEEEETKKRAEEVKKALEEAKEEGTSEKEKKNKKNKKVIKIREVYVDAEGNYFKDIEMTKPISAKIIQELRKEYIIVEKEAGSIGKKDVVILYAYKDYLYYDKETRHMVTEEVYDKIKKVNKIKEIEVTKKNKKEKPPINIYYIVVNGEKKYYFDKQGKREIPKIIREVLFSKRSVSLIPASITKSKKKKFEVFYDRFGYYYYDDKATNPISTEDLEIYKNDPKVEVVESKVEEVNKVIYYDEKSDSYFKDKEGMRQIANEDVEELKVHPRLVMTIKNIDLGLEKQEIKEKRKEVKTKKKLTIYRDENGKYYSDSELTKPISDENAKGILASDVIDLDIIDVESIKKKVVVYYDGRKYFLDKGLKTEIRSEKIEEMKESIKYDLVIKSIKKELVVYTDAEGNYYSDELATMLVSVDKLTKLEENYNIIIKPVATKQISVYYDGKNYYHDSNLTHEYTKEEIKNISKNPCYVIEVVRVKSKEVVKEAKEDLTASEILSELRKAREEMARILNIGYSENVENEYEHSIAYQLDEWEVNRFQSLRENVNRYKEELQTLRRGR